MSFAEHVKAYKKKKGMNSRLLSERSGIPKGTLDKLLSGEIAEPKLSVALAIARALDCPLTALTEGEEGGTAAPLSAEEQRLLADFRRLDTHSRQLVQLVMDKQLSLQDTAAPAESKPAARILSLPTAGKRLQVPLFHMPVSAGTGMFLEGDSADMMTLPEGYPAGKADFALRVSGHSMEPTFLDGDILLVRSQQKVEMGELGIFVADGEGYFKRFMGDCLRSLNPAYSDLPLKEFRDLRCCGKVVGKLGKKRS